MKRFSVTIVFFLAIASVLAMTKEERRAKWEEINNECNADPATAVDGAAVKSWLESGKVGEKPANLGVHAHCMCKKLQWQDEEGNILLESMKKALIESGVPADKVDSLLTKCAVAKETKEETAQGMIVCVRSTVHKHEKKH